MLVVQQNWMRCLIFCSLSPRVTNVHIHVFLMQVTGTLSQITLFPLELMGCLCVTSVASKRKHSASPVLEYSEKETVLLEDSYRIQKSSPNLEHPLLNYFVTSGPKKNDFQFLLQQQLWVKQWLWCAQGTKPENVRQRAQMQNFLL